MHDEELVERAAGLLARYASGPLHLDVAARLVSVPSSAAETGLVTTIVTTLADAGVLVDALEVRRPSLDDVFLELTGHRAEQPVIDDDEEVAA